MEKGTESSDHHCIAKKPVCYNLYPDEKGTESIARERNAFVKYRYNLYPDEKGTESVKSRQSFIAPRQVTTYTPMKRGLKVGKLPGRLRFPFLGYNLYPDEKGTRKR